MGMSFKWCSTHCWRKHKKYSVFWENNEKWCHGEFDIEFVKLRKSSMCMLCFKDQLLKD